MNQPKQPSLPRWRTKPLTWAARFLCSTGLVLACHGCGKAPPLVTDETPPPFSFRALDLQQRTTDGKPAWSLSSPEARYDLRSSVARALRPQGVIFAKGKPLYKLTATTGTVINDGAVILLEGDIQLQRLGENPLLLRANRALWIPRDSLMRFELGPQVRNLQHQISAQTATLLLDRDLLKLIGETKVERWSRPMALNGKGPQEAPEIQGTMKEVEWHPGTGELKAQGPVSMSRRPPKSAAQRPPQVLKATRLEGNTLKQEFTLFGPVDIDDPAEQSWFRGAVLTFNTKEEWLTSASPFQAQKGELRVQGDEVRLDGKSSLATIGQNCQLQQGGDGLQAQRCQWNWQTQAVKGEGQVRWRRQTNDQLTRAERMEGRIGPKGHLEAITPGGRVVSQLRVPRRAGAPQPQKPRPKPEPIVF